MKLLTKELRAALPALRSQDGKNEAAIVHAHYFSILSGWDWWVLEGEPDVDESGAEVDFRFFGFVAGWEGEYGYFSLNELDSAKRGGLMPLVERDLHWTPKPIGEVLPPGNPRRPSWWAEDEPATAAGGAA